MPKKIFDNLSKYHFEFKHLSVLFIGLILFQFILSLTHKSSLNSFVEKSQEWYQNHSAERLAEFSTTSLELLFETTILKAPASEEEKRKIIHFFDIILNQQLLQQNIEEICLLVNEDKAIRAIDNGRDLYEFIFSQKFDPLRINKEHDDAIRLYQQISNELYEREQVINILKDKNDYHIFVPFVPNGEFVGALYIKSTPDFSFIQREIISSYEETSILYSALFLLGLISMYYISSYTVKERDEAQKMLLEEHERNIKQQYDHEKESLFTKRIYHTHHKAEKVMGFIKEDLRTLSAENIDEIKYRVGKYSNFISRVIYDMKWYDPPIQTIRNTSFNTDLNEVIRFIVDNLFNRTAKKSSSYEILLNFDDKVPTININEFVIWEIIEPLIQNSLDHGGEIPLKVNITTSYHPERSIIICEISDNGKGISPEMLKIDSRGIKKLFLENVSTKNQKHSSGYGCYIAYQIAKGRCGWDIDVENKPEGGCIYRITIPN
jgi:signal transduction histidine kinase